MKTTLQGLGLSGIFLTVGTVGGVEKRSLSLGQALIILSISFVILGTIYFLSDRPRKIDGKLYYKTSHFVSEGYEQNDIIQAIKNKVPYVLVKERLYISEDDFVDFYIKNQSPQKRRP